MTLVAGTRLGPYEVIALIGAGGMGEVYRAKDPRLGRDVAIKVLPASFATDPDRLRRFEQEARAAGMLNHPNIVAVYDIAQHDGAPYVVEELLEGETLRAYLSGRKLSQQKAIDHALQIARGLAAAHEKGIVHRDLKPENIFVIGDGRLKILDFGLAKLVQAEEGLPLSNLETAAAGTGPGVLMGSVGYMSPEQVRGKPADTRSDIFSFGAVLYEMLSGTRAFGGESAADSMSAILKEDPPELSQINPRTPPGLERVVRHCLEKDPVQRFHSVHDLAFDLEAISGISLDPGAPPSSLPRRIRPGKVLNWIVLPLLAAAFWTGRRSLTGTRPVTTSPGVFRQLTYQPGWELHPNLSPDGTSFIYVSGTTRSDIYFQRVGGRNAINLTKDFSAASTEPAFSPSGDLIAFRSGKDGGGIFLMGATGENIRRLTDFGFSPAWSPDGRRLAFSSQSFPGHPFNRKGYGDLWTLDVASGQKERLVEGEVRAKGVEGDAVQPSWSPHGHRIAYWGLRGETGRRNIWTISAKGGPPVGVTDGASTDWNPIWSPDGRYLYFGSDRGGSVNLWRVAIDERTGKTLADPEPVTLPSTWVGLFTFSRDGKRLAYSTRESRGTVSRVSFDGAAQTISGRTTILDTSMSIADLSVSPDDRWLAFRPVGGSREDIYLVQSDGSGLSRLTDDSYRNRGPIFAPDGKRLAFYSNRSGRYEIWTISPDGSGLSKITENVGTGPEFPYWSPDGTRLAFSDGHTSFIMRTTGTPAERAPEAIAALSDGALFLVFGWSPDGRYLVGGRTESASSNLGIFTYEVATKKFTRLTETGGGTARPLAIGFGTGRAATYLPDGKHVLYLDNSILHVVDLSTKRTRPLAEASVLGPLIGFALSNDGRSLYLLESREEADIWMATIP